MHSFLICKDTVSHPNNPTLWIWTISFALKFSQKYQFSRWNLYNILIFKTILYSTITAANTKRQDENWFLRNKLMSSNIYAVSLCVSSFCTNASVCVCVRVRPFVRPLDSPAPRFAVSSSGATALAARPTAASPTRATAPWSTPATTRSPSAWTTSRAAAPVRSASTSTPRPTCRPKLRPLSTRPARQLWLLKPLPQLQPWWEHSTAAYSTYCTSCLRSGRAGHTHLQVVQGLCLFIVWEQELVRSIHFITITLKLPIRA